MSWRVAGFRWISRKTGWRRNEELCEVSMDAEPAKGGRGETRNDRVYVSGRLEDQLDT